VSILQAIVLGAVQGVTEFVPISSSGHLVLVPAALGWRDPGLTFDVLLHAASLVALLVYFSGDLVDLFRGLASGDADARRLVTLLAIGTVPAVAAALLLGDFFEDSFTDARASALQLIVTAAILIGAEQILRYHERRTAQRGARLRTLGELGPSDAGIIGVAQAVAILPGISRSGTTIGAGLALSVARDDAARFSFLLLIPALVGATIVEAPELADASIGFGAGAAGFVASGLTSYAAIWSLIRYLRTNTLYPFAAYCIIAGLAFYVAL
jgi:undecaprenyl-diphosphatase